MREEMLRRRQRAAGDPTRRQPPTREYAEFLADALLAKVQIKRPPVDVDLCGEGAGIKLIHRDEHMRRLTAILATPMGIPSISVNATHPVTRQRFSIAHEIGHWVLERAPATQELAPIAARGRAYTDLERVCDYFAASLLMPRLWIQADVAEGRTTGELAKRYEVSSLAMSKRMRELELATQRGRLK